MKIFVSLFSFFLISLSQADDYNLAIGETFLLKTAPLETIRLQKKGIVSIKDRGTHLIFTGKKIGETSLSVGGTQHIVRVLKKENAQTYNELKLWITNKRGPTLFINNGQLEVKGRLLRLSDFKNLKNFTHSQSNFSILSEINENLREELNSYVTERLQEHNLNRGELIFTPKLQLRLSDRNKSMKTRYQNILNPYGIGLIFDEQNLTQEPVIKIQVYIAHVNKSFMRQWGVSWPSQISTTLIQGEALKVEAFTLSLKALETDGQGKLLATPTLITESNKTAEFHSGGEFPITTTNQFNNSVQWKQYGLFLKTKPIANAQKHLQINIDLELSSLDQNLNTDGVPALVKSQVKTQVNMKSPAPILLSGFLRQDQGNSRSGLPWLKQIPLFEPLFSTGAIYNNELELVFILVPSFYGD